MISNRQASTLFTQLRNMKDLTALERRLSAALKRNATAANVRDGYRGANFEPGRSSERSDPTYETAHSNVTGFPLRDPVGDAVEAAAGYLEQAVDSVNALRSTLNRIDNLASDQDLNPDPMCWAMARVGVFEPAITFSDAKGAMNEPKHWGRWALDYALATGQAPTPEQCRAHAEGRKVRLKAS